MGTRSVGEQRVRTLQKTNTGTYTVSLPIQLVRDLRWQDGQKVIIRRSGKKLIVEDWQQ
jgi:phosphate uptake regulator